MTRKEALRERYEDALFALLMDEYADAEGKRLEEENEALQNDPEAAVPEEVQRRCLRTIRRCFAARRARSAGWVAVKLLNRVAVVVMVSIMFFTVAFAASPEFRVNTLNFMIDVFDEGTRFGFDQNTTVGVNGSSDKQVTVGWVPAGFVEVSDDMDVFGEELSYVRDEDEITISYMEGTDTGLILNTEDAEVSTIPINGYTASLIIRDNVVSILWADKSAGFMVLIHGFGSVSSEEIIQVAENIEISPKS